MKGRLTVIRTPYHTDPLVLLQPVDLIQKVASGGGRHETVDVFEDQETRRGFACFFEDPADAVFGIGSCKGFDVEAGNGAGEVAGGSHQGFDGDCFAITWRAVENKTALREEVSWGSMREGM